MDETSTCKLLQVTFHSQHTLPLPVTKSEAGYAGNSAANRTDFSCEGPGEHMALIRGQGRERRQWKVHRMRERERGGLYVCVWEYLFVHALHVV